jgi:hypothetical protein
LNNPQAVTDEHATWMKNIWQSQDETLPMTLWLLEIPDGTPWFCAAVDLISYLEAAWPEM